MRTVILLGLMHLSDALETMPATPEDETSMLFLGGVLIAAMIMDVTEFVVNIVKDG